MNHTYQLGIDLGGTKIEGIILDSNGNECFERCNMNTEQEHGYWHILNNIKQVYDCLVAQIGGAEHTFGIGTPGAISHNTGLLKNSNTVCMNGKPLVKDLKKILNRKTIGIQNDANCFAMAEALNGAGKGKEMVFGVIMGTGCGGGLIYQQKVWKGLQGIGGEWGHMTIDPNGPTCYCGKNGCTETYISGGGAERRYKREFGEELGLRQIVKNYQVGEAKATEFIQQFFVDFGRAISNLLTILDPDIVVIGGGVSNVNELYTKGIKEVEEYHFSDSLDTPIVKNQLGASAGVIGAALIGL